MILYHYLDIILKITCLSDCQHLPNKDSRGNTPNIQSIFFNHRFIDKKMIEPRQHIIIEINFLPRDTCIYFGFSFSERFSLYVCMIIHILSLSWSLHIKHMHILFPNEYKKYVFTNKDNCVHIYIYIYIYTYTHIHAHERKQVINI